jgi:hypothetical protein
MPAIAMPTLRLMPVMMSRRVKSSRCSQQPQPIRTLLPASSGQIPLAQAQGSPSASAVDGGHEVYPRPPITDKSGIGLSVRSDMVPSTPPDVLVWVRGSGGCIAGDVGAQVAEDEFDGVGNDVPGCARGAGRSCRAAATSWCWIHR